MIALVLTLQGLTEDSTVLLSVLESGRWPTPGALLPGRLQAHWLPEAGEGQGPRKSVSVSCRPPPTQMLSPQPGRQRQGVANSPGCVPELIQKDLVLARPGPLTVVRTLAGMRFQEVDAQLLLEEGEGRKGGAHSSCLCMSMSSVSMQVGNAAQTPVGVRAVVGCDGCTDIAGSLSYAASDSLCSDITAS